MTRSNHPCLWLITWDPSQPVSTRPLAIQKDGTWYTYGWDLTKNICEVYGQHGYIRTNYSYSPYGEVTISGDVTQPMQWSSEYSDSEIDLVYYNYRHYSPTDGRWLQYDAVELIDFYKTSRNMPILITDYLGLWKEDPENENIRIAERGDTLSGLSLKISGTILDWPCLWPAANTENHGYPDRIMPCDKYDISNLITVEGKKISYYLDRNLSQYAQIFPSAVYIKPKDVPGSLKNISGEGATPISNFISAGHGGNGGYLNGVWTNYSVQEILKEAINKPSFEQAMHKRGPIRCWFTRTAQARFSGCSTSDEIAREFAKKVLRKKAVAYGTNQRIGTSYSQGKAWVYYGYTPLPDNTYDWGTVKEYFSEEAKKAVWNTHNGAL